MDADILSLEALSPGERFCRIGAPHFVWIKTSHSWAHAIWKGKRIEQPMHHTTLVRRALADKLNPGELAPVIGSQRLA